MADDLEPEGPVEAATTRGLALFGRIWAGAILCFIAFAPAWVGFGVLAQVVAKPSELDFPALAVIGACFALVYFLLLIAWRAFTGRGRALDGELLPPWAMSAFVATFGVMAILIIVYGAYTGKYGAIVGGVCYLVIALAVQMARKIRRAQRQLDA